LTEIIGKIPHIHSKDVKLSKTPKKQPYLAIVTTQKLFICC